MSPGFSRMRDEAGSAIAEFVMVSALLTVLALGVVQLALALHVRNTVLDAAAEGARYGALADNTPADGATRTAELVAVALGEGYPVEVDASLGDYLGIPAVVVQVTAPLPLAGLFGPASLLEVEGHAALEDLD